MATETLSSLDALDAFAVRVMESLSKRSSATVLALQGDLGAGKTAFTKALARALGVLETVTSPTFLVMRAYALQNQHYSTLVHIDAYRIDDEDELRILGMRELLDNPGNLIVVEWAERVPSYIPSGAFQISFVHEKGERRTITHTIYDN